MSLEITTPETHGFANKTHPIYLYGKYNTSSMAENGDHKWRFFYPTMVTTFFRPWSHFFGT